MSQSQYSAGERRRLSHKGPKRASGSSLGAFEDAFRGLPPTHPRSGKAPNNGQNSGWTLRNTAAGGYHAQHVGRKRLVGGPHFPFQWPRKCPSLLHHLPMAWLSVCTSLQQLEGQPPPSLELGEGFPPTSKRQCLTQSASLALKCRKEQSHLGLNGTWCYPV